MNESQEGLNYNEMKEELQALRKKLEDLENKHSALQVGAHPIAHRRFSRRLITASITVAVLLVAAGGLLWGEQSGTLPPLFVNNKGDVGIGTNDPKAKLDVAGKLKAAETEVSGLLKAGTVVADSAQVTAGTLDVSNKAIAGTLESRGDLTANRAFITTLQGPPVDLRVAQPKLTIQGDVQVNGTVAANNTTGGINGEKSPIRINFMYNNPRREEILDIRPLCQDDDGCTIMLMMKNNDGTLILDWYHIDIDKSGYGTTINYKGQKYTWELGSGRVPNDNIGRIIPFEHNWCLADTREKDRKAYFYCTNALTATIEIFDK